MDLYVFLSSHLYLLRLALIENFILFTNRCARVCAPDWRRTVRAHWCEGEGDCARLRR